MCMISAGTVSCVSRVEDHSDVGSRTRSPSPQKVRRLTGSAPAAANDMSLQMRSVVFSKADRRCPASEHGGLGLQDGLRSGVPGKRSRVFGAVPADRHGVQPVVPPHVALEG